jgi:hypothetical protein
LHQPFKIRKRRGTVEKFLKQRRRALRIKSALEQVRKRRPGCRWRDRLPRGIGRTPKKNPNGGRSVFKSMYVGATGRSGSE